jgi:hypothetical protein
MTPARNRAVILEPRDIGTVYVPDEPVWFPPTNRHANKQSKCGNTTMSSSSRFDSIRPSTQRPTKRPLIRILLSAGVLVFASLGVTSPTLARTNFDGDWSVVIQTRGGACMPSLRYPVAITNGVVTNGGETPATVQGRVAPNGAVRVTVQSGSSWASGSGRLTTTGGSGVWRGQGTSGLCEGTWQAQRRSYGAQVMRGGAPIYNYAPQPSRRYYPGPSR